MTWKLNVIAQTTTTPVAPRRKWRRVALLLLPLLVIGVLLLSVRRRPPPLPPVVVMPLPYKIPAQKVPLPDRWIPRSWGWLWRLKQRVFGPAKVIQIEAAIFGLPVLADWVPSGLALGRPVFETNGLRVWLVPKAEIGALRRRLDDATGRDSTFTPRIQTADGMQAQLFMGNTFPVGGTSASVGKSVEILPHIRADSTDLTAIVRLTEAVTNEFEIASPAWPTGSISVRTNCEVAARIQIPKDTSVFFLETGPGSAEGKRFGLILSAERPAKKKK